MTKYILDVLEIFHNASKGIVLAVFTTPKPDYPLKYINIIPIYIPVFLDVSEMRASGKYSPNQINETIIKRVNDGTYKAPSRVGISYMIARMMRSHPNTWEIVNMTMPHYMFYAPRIDNSDVGSLADSQHPFVIDSGDFLDKNNSSFNFIIIKAGETAHEKRFLKKTRAC